MKNLQFASTVLIGLFCVALIGCNADDKPIGGGSGTGSGGINEVVSFEDLVPNTVVALRDYSGIQWDNDGLDVGWGWSVWNVPNSEPASGQQYAINSHGKNYLGLTFDQRVIFQSISVAQCSRRMSIPVEDPESFAAQRIRLHYFDAEEHEIGLSEWFELGRQPIVINGQVRLSRLVIEHDADTSYANDMHGVPQANWYSIDDLTFKPMAVFDPSAY